MIQCVICGGKRPNSNGNYIKEDFCSECLEKETKFLEKVRSARDKKEASPDPAKDTREA